MPACEHRPRKIALAVVMLIGASTGFAQQFFTDRAAFLAHVKPGYYEETFDGFSEGEPLDGHQPFWEGPGGNGFSWEASATGQGNQLLYALYRAISTSAHDDALIFQFSGEPVYAFGGDFWGTQYDGFPLTAEIIFETDTGESFVHEVSGRSFLGIISNVPLTSVTIGAVAGGSGAWPTADSIITGDLNPDSDLDGDGMTNQAERLAGTDPGDPTSALRVTSLTKSDAGMAIGFSAVAGKSYRLEYKDLLGDAAWLRLSDYFATSSGPTEITDRSESLPPCRFYRVLLLLP
jgi:hypothetical protein